MVNRKYLKRITAIVTALICMADVTGCQSSPAASDMTVATTIQEGTGSGSDTRMVKDTFDGQTGEETDGIDIWKEDNYQEIIFQGDSIFTLASGVTVEGSTVTFTEAGTYVLSGTLNDGQIVVNATKEDKVILVLNGVEITCKDSSPIYVMQADKTILYLADGTVNRVSDGSVYVFENGETEPDAAIFAKDDLTIKGTGSLTVDANYQDGIVCKNDLKITGGILTIDAVNQGIKGKDSLTIKGGDITVTAGDDGIKSSNEALEEDGKAVGWVWIEGGTITVTAGDDAIHAESDLTIEGGTITIIKSYEGLEGACIYINGGDISLYASDDGINAAGYAVGGTVANGTEKAAYGMGWDNRGGRGEMWNMGSASSGGYLEINGGTVYVNAEGDGIDVNGSVVMNGGTVLVDGSVGNGNGALDYDQTFEMKGGLLISVGSSGMAQTVSTTSTQYSASVYFNATQAAGSTITVKDASDAEIISYTPQKGYSFLTFSSTKLQEGSTYTVLVDGAEQQSFTISDMVTVAGNGGGMGYGGMRGHGDMEGHGGMGGHDSWDRNMPAEDGMGENGMMSPEGIPNGGGMGENEMMTPPEGMPNGERRDK